MTRSRQRHGRACQRKSGLPDLRHLNNSAELGQARVLAPSTSLMWRAKTWMPGTSPGMTRGSSMIVDFQHHFTPHALMPNDMGRRKLITYDEHGAPSFIMHWMLFDLDEHIRMMDESGIDV